MVPANGVDCRFHLAGESSKILSDKSGRPEDDGAAAGVPGGKPPVVIPCFVRPASMDEHRIATRHRVLKAGTIEFGGGAIDCTVRNISATGAALDVASPLGIPAQFTLVTDGNHLSCRVVWRKEKRIGVTFDQTQSSDPQP
jgi:hypothetical protein